MRGGGGWAVLALILAAGCRIEDRTPTGSRRDDQSIRAVVATYYRSLSTRDWPSSRSVFADSAQVLVRGVDDTGSSRFATAEAYHLELIRRARDQRVEAGEVLVARLDVRQEGELAAVWVAARHHVSDPDRAESRSADHFVLRRVDGAWRVVGFYSTPASDLPAR